MVINNLVLFDMPTECFALEFSLLWKRGARAAVAAALVERGLWGRIQRVSPIEVACVAVAEVPDGQARLIDFVNWLRGYARWDTAYTGPMPPDAGRKAVMIGTCLLVDPNDGIHISSDPRFVGLLGTRLAVRTTGAPSPRSFGAPGAYTVVPTAASQGQHSSPPQPQQPPPAQPAQQQQAPSPPPPVQQQQPQQQKQQRSAAAAAAAMQHAQESLSYSDASADPRGVAAVSDTDRGDSDSPSVDAYRHYSTRSSRR